MVNLSSSFQVFWRDNDMILYFLLSATSNEVNFLNGKVAKKGKQDFLYTDFHCLLICL